MERRVREATKPREKDQVHPTLLFHFEPGQIVTRRHRAFSKLDPRTTGPFRVRTISGVYRQRVTIEPLEEASRRRRVTVHASQLVPFEEPYAEPGVIDLSEDATPEPGADDAPTRRGLRSRKRRKAPSVWDLAKEI